VQGGLVSCSRRSGPETGRKPCVGRGRSGGSRGLTSAFTRRSCYCSPGRVGGAPGFWYGRRRPWRCALHPGTLPIRRTPRALISDHRLEGVLTPDNVGEFIMIETALRLDPAGQAKA
jgi:hypothetical protein